MFWNCKTVKEHIAVHGELVEPSAATLRQAQGERREVFM
jgi:hypothetical protein